ncbi:MAG: fibronectin type III domain-containing protein, partial [Clostridia bacterium]|nr:fibronectin type III domain-containing protein [Clostridia bacterium]
MSQTVFAASTITWTGAAGDGLWHNAGNWDLNQIPVDNDYVAIPESSVVVYSGGETSVRLNCAGHLTVSGGTLKLASGNSSLTNGKLDGAGDITITAGGNFLWSGGSIEGSGKIIVDQNANFYADQASLNRYLVNNGSLLINGSSLTLTGGAEGGGYFPIQEGETLELGGNGSYNISGQVGGSGTLIIANTCAAVRFSNTYYQQQSTGTMVFAVGGLADFTKLELSGQAYLAGKLELNLIDEYVPQSGDTFEVMAYASKTGTFSSIAGNVPGISLVPTYTGTALTLTVQQVTVPAAPQSLNATPGDGQVALSWTAPASDGGAAITGYEVSKDNGASWVDAGLSTSYSFTSLINGTAYTFKVRAVNSAG